MATYGRCNNRPSEASIAWCKINAYCTAVVGQCSEASTLWSMISLCRKGLVLREVANYRQQAIYDNVISSRSTRHLPHCIPLTFVELLLSLEAGLGGRRAPLDPQARQVHAAAAARGRGAVGVASRRRIHHGRGGGGGGPGGAVQVRDGDVVRRDGAGKDGGETFRSV